MVVNILQDGTTVEDMSTVTVPVNDSTIIAYDLLVKGCVA